MEVVVFSSCFQCVSIRIFCGSFISCISMTFFERVFKDFIHSDCAFICQASEFFKRVYRVKRNTIRQIAYFYVLTYNSFNSNKISIGNDYLLSHESFENDCSLHSRFYLSRQLRIEFLKYCIQNNFDIYD